MNKIKFILPLLVAPFLFNCNKGVAGKYKYNNNEISYTKGSKDSFKDFDSSDFFVDETMFIDSTVINLQTDGKGEKQDGLSFSPINITNPVVDEQNNPVSNYGTLNERDVSEMEKTNTCDYGQVKEKWHLYKSSLEGGKIIVSRYIIGQRYVSSSSSGNYAYKIFDQELQFNGSILKIICDFDFTFNEESVIKGTLTLNYSKA